MERNADNGRLGPPGRPKIDPDELERHLASLRESIALTQELLAKARATLAAAPGPPEEDEAVPSTEKPSGQDTDRAA